jgi:hypothetical protein
MLTPFVPLDQAAAHGRSTRRAILLRATAAGAVVVVCAVDARFAQAQPVTPSTTATTTASPAAPTQIRGEVATVDVAARMLSVRPTGGAVVSIALHEKATIVKVAPGATSLQGASPIELGSIAAGDKVLVQGGKLSGANVSGALRLVLMSSSDLKARDEADARAWRERAISGVVVSIDAGKTEVAIRPSGGARPPAASPETPGAAGSPAAARGITPNLVIAISAKTALHRYADTSVRFEDASPAALADIAPGDQIRALGSRSPDGSRVTADRVVFGSFRTAALAIERVDPATGDVFVKDLESSKKFALRLANGAVLRRIPDEMKPMIQVMAGGGAAPGRSAGMGRPLGAGGPGPGQGQGAGGGRGVGMGGRPGMGGGGAGRIEDMVERMPGIAIADLKKDDWIGAVIGRVDAQGRALGFNVLLGIDAFATRTAFGGVDIGFDSGLLESALSIQ